MWNFLRRITLTQWILIAMALGVALGVVAREVGHPEYATSLRPISTTFLRMIKSVIVPIIFGTLVVGIAGHGDDMKRVGRLAFKSLVYFEVVTTLALFIGLLAVNLVKPGVGVTLQAPAAAAAPAGGLPGGDQPTFSSVLEHIVPQSFSRRRSRIRYYRSSSGRCCSRLPSRRSAGAPRTRCSDSAKVWRRSCSSSPRSS